MRIPLNFGAAVLSLCFIFSHSGAKAQTNVYTLPFADVRGARAIAFVHTGTLPQGSIFLETGGAGYTSPPNVSIVVTKGTGGGAVVTATVQNGSVTALTVQNGGSFSPLAEAKVVIDLPPNPIQGFAGSPTNTYGTIILPAGYFEMTTVISNNITIRGQGMNLTTVSGGGQGSV